MDGNMSQGGLLSGRTVYGGFDFQGQMTNRRQENQPNTMPQHRSQGLQGSSLHPSVHDSFLLTIGNDQNISMVHEFSRGEKNKNSASENGDVSFTEECLEENGDASQTKMGLPWQRVKWTDKIVKLLITAVSYISEDATSDFGNGGRRRCAILQRKGKWKSISKVMAERGYHVSPQQCEDKFNDLNKRYKKLNDMLGRGTSCQVVENPALLDLLNHLSDRDKDEVRKILSSKQLFYEEMCSYHNRNRLHLPHDPALQRSLLAALRNRDDRNNEDVRRNNQSDDLDEDDKDVEIDDCDNFEDNNASHVDDRVMYSMLPGSTKKLRQCLDPVKTSNPHKQIGQAVTSRVLPDSMRAADSTRQWTDSCLLQLEEKKLRIEVELLEIEKQKFKWRKSSEKQDRELEKMRMENEMMKLENERMALELKRREIEASLK